MSVTFHVGYVSVFLQCLLLVYPQMCLRLDLLVYQRQDANHDWDY